MLSGDAESNGGGLFARRIIERLAGRSEMGRQRLASDGALEVYEAAFRREGVLRAACRDHEAGAGVDVEMQDKDQRRETKVEVPVLVLFASFVYLDTKTRLHQALFGLFGLFAWFAAGPEPYAGRIFYRS